MSFVGHRTERDKVFKLSSCNNSLDPSLVLARDDENKTSDVER